VISTLAVASIVGFSAGGGAYLLDRVALTMIRPPAKKVSRKVEGLPFSSRKILFDSGGIELVGWAVQPEADLGGAAVVLVHGWGSNHENLVRLAAPLLGAGYPVFLFDVRHHGESRGAPYVTARHYRDDTRSACDEAERLFPGRPLALVGHSMGGSAGIVAVAEGAPVQGLVSISAPADLWEVWAYHFDRKGLPGRWVIRVLGPFWRVRAGVPFRILDPVSRIGDLAVPLMILHGDEDESVGVDHGHRLARAAGVDARILVGEGHSDLLESPDLHHEVLGFLEELGS
jgi:alpha-beta hydrolase superfamily lysophospholipase